MRWLKVGQAVGGIVLLALFIFLLFFQRADYLYYTEQPYYQRAQQLTKMARNRYQLVREGLFKVGWSRQNITPTQPAHLMGYGWKGNYEQVHDSLWVRTLVFQLDTLVVSLVTYDLMLTPPLVAQQVVDTLSSLGIDHIYFTATHTHKGYGGWEQGFGRELIAGRYDASSVRLLVNQTITSLRQAYRQAIPSQIAYVQFNLDSLVNNRLIRGGDVEPYLRAIYFQRQDSSLGVFSSFSAHATFVSSKSKDLSADYPGELVRQLEEDSQVDFALFAAGAVGSHSPHQPQSFTYENLQNYANRLATPLLSAIDNISYDSVSRLGFSEIELPMGEPQLRVAENWRVRPFWFRQIMGNQSPAVTFLQLENIALVGTPGDFSGLLYDQINSNRQPLVITSFNGEYIGYIIPSQHYHLNHRETRSINWFGPYTGDYITEMINQNLTYIRKD